MIEVLHPLMESKYSFLVWCKILVFSQDKGFDPYCEGRSQEHTFTYNDSSVIKTLDMQSLLQLGCTSQIFMCLLNICVLRPHLLFNTRFRNFH